MNFSPTSAAILRTKLRLAASSIKPPKTALFSIPRTPPQVPSDVNAVRKFHALLGSADSCMHGNRMLAADSSGQRNVHSHWLRELRHSVAPTTGKSEMATGLSQVQANLFSDLALHHMGRKLADGISQGNAGPDQFRTAPLWGVGQRVFFLHDGRTRTSFKPSRDHKSPGSEATQVINNYEGLSCRDKQNLILFLRSL